MKEYLIAEFIPFKDESFEYVTAISSLDYVLLFEPLMERCSYVKDSHYQDRWGNHFYAYIKC